MNKKLTLGMLAVLALGACTQDDISEQQVLQDGTLRFAPEMVSDWNAPWTRSAADNDVAVQQLQDGLYLHTLISPGISTGNTVTRGTKYEGYEVTGETYKSFKTDGTETFRVSGYRYGAAESVSSVAHANFFNNATVRYNGDWRATGQTYVMPAATDKTDFFGWFVADEETAGVTAEDAAGGLQLSYTVPADIDQQPDLLTAVAREQIYSTATSTLVPLQFTHQLTAVNFVLDENVAPGTITEIALMNVYTSGTLSVSDGISGNWSLTNAPTETTYSTTFNTVNDNALRTGETIVGGLMMIPQQFTEEGQQIRIKMTIDGTPRNLFANLKGTRWEPNTTVTYKVSTSAVNVLRIGTVSYPTSWSAASTENSDIKSDYANGDEIGVYGVDATGNVIFANKKYTLTDGSWVADDGTKSLFVPGHTYYAYYPYQETLSGGPAENANVMVGEALPTAAAFFADAITNWAPADDQSTATKLNAQDLQVSRSNPSTISTVTFSMAHTMGLVSLTLEQKALPTTRYFTVNADNTVSTTSYTDIGTTSVTAAHDFEQYEQMLAKDNKLYYVTRPSQEMTVTSTSTAEGKWKTASVTLTAAAAAYNSGTAELARTYLYRGWAYSYRQKGQSFTPPVNGKYRIECWGASGGRGWLYQTTPDNTANKGGGMWTYYGYGAYTAGDIELPTTRTLYVFVGGAGQNAVASSTTQDVVTPGGWNGGGRSWNGKSNNDGGGSGGGATDVRTVMNGETAWNNFASLKSRIMVAAGGGGTSTTCDAMVDHGADYTEGLHAGGLKVSGKLTPWCGSWDNRIWVWEPVVNQTTGYQFGTGANSRENGHFSEGGGGGGYYGGVYGNVGNTEPSSWGKASGGSSFISGHEGCNAINDQASTSVSSMSHSGQANHYSGLIFSPTTMIDGRGYKWTTVAGSKIGVPKTSAAENETAGHTGNGYCRIAATFVE